MSGPVRVQLSRRRGWTMPENAVSVARPTKWGNPFRVGPDLTQQEAVDEYRSLLIDGRYREVGGVTAESGALYAIGVRLEIHKLKGKSLACWCSPGSPCHADVLLEMANG